MKNNKIQSNSQTIFETFNLFILLTTAIIIATFVYSTKILPTHDFSNYTINAFKFFQSGNFNQKSILYSPLYSLYLYPFIALKLSPWEIYQYSNIFSLSLFSFLVYILLNKMYSRNISFLIIILLYSTFQYTSVAKHGIHLFYSIWIVLFLLYLLGRDFKKVDFGLIILALGIFIRPEFLYFLAFYSIFQLLFNRNYLRIKNNIFVLVFSILIVILYFNHKKSPSRALLAIKQSYNGYLFSKDYKKHNQKKALKTVFVHKKYTKQFKKDFNNPKSFKDVVLNNPNLYFSFTFFSFTELGRILLKYFNFHLKFPNNINWQKVTIFLPVAFLCVISYFLLFFYIFKRIKRKKQIQIKSNFSHFEIKVILLLGLIFIQFSTILIKSPKEMYFVTVPFILLLIFKLFITKYRKRLVFKQFWKNTNLKRNKLVINIIFSIIIFFTALSVISSYSNHYRKNKIRNLYLDIAKILKMKSKNKKTFVYTNYRKPIKANLLFLNSIKNIVFVKRLKNPTKLDAIIIGKKKKMSLKNNKKIQMQLLKMKEIKYKQKGISLYLRM